MNKFVHLKKYVNGREWEFSFFPYTAYNGKMWYRFFIYWYPYFDEFHFGKVGRQFFIGNIGIIS